MKLLILIGAKKKFIKAEAYSNPIYGVGKTAEAIIQALINY